MRKVPRGKVVRESKRYDDLLDKSSSTQALLKDKRGTVRKKLFSEQKRRAEPTVSPVRVHLRSRKAANEFAALIRQSLRSSSKKIVFTGWYDDDRKIIRIPSRLSLEKCVYVDDSTRAPPAKPKRKKWNTSEFYERTWIDMPPFENEKVSAFVTFRVSFPTLEDKIAFAELVKQPISHKTKSIWFPLKESESKTSLVWIGRKETSVPRYPVFIVSKGRAQYGPLTAKVLRDLGIPFYLMVEPHEYDKYRVLCDWAKDVCKRPLVTTAVSAC